LLVRDSEQTNPTIETNSRQIKKNTVFRFKNYLQWPAVRGNTVKPQFHVSCRVVFLYFAKTAMQKIEGKMVLITGGSKGIGYGIAESLMRENAKVAITSRTQAAANTAAVELNKIGKGEAIGIAADVR
jgi:glutamyl-tRNA reductase